MKQEKLLKMKQDRRSLILARGEISDHAHILISYDEVKKKKNGFTIESSPDYDIYVPLLESFLDESKDVSFEDRVKLYEEFQLKVEDLNVTKLRHLKESSFVERGEEIWTKEHLDIPLKEGEYEYIAQEEYDPYEQKIMQTKD